MELFLVIVFIEYLCDDAQVIMDSFGFLSVYHEIYLVVEGGDDEDELVLAELVDEV